MFPESLLLAITTSHLALDELYDLVLSLVLTSFLK